MCQNRQFDVLEGPILQDVFAFSATWPLATTANVILASAIDALRL